MQIKISRLAFAWVVALSISIPNSWSQETIMTIGTVAPADSPWSALLQQFKEAVEKKTAGKVKVKIMLGGVLGDENEMVTKVSRGQIQAVGASTGALATKVPEVNLVELPFIFRNTDEADKIIDKVLTKPYEKFFSDRGLILGFWSENGYRMFASRDKAMTKPDDLKGRKMRAQESPVHLAMYKALGASAVPIPTTEVPQALATGNVDGFDQALLYMIAAGWQKSVKHVTISEHIYQPAAIVFNKEWYSKLPANIQKILIDEGRSVQVKGRKAVRAIQPELLGILEYEKIAVKKLSAAEKAAFETATKPVYEDFRKTFGKDASALLDTALAELKKIRGGK
ncbi:MAG: TRAP transporter substrate-binding protein [Bdellovibrionales bacterium]|nr:TRAP transporter substrate-binding protein [Bdellovibrionales bacterium]